MVRAVCVYVCASESVWDVSSDQLRSAMHRGVRFMHQAGTDGSVGACDRCSRINSRASDPHLASIDLWGALSGRAHRLSTFSACEMREILHNCLRLNR